LANQIASRIAEGLSFDAAMGVLDFGAAAASAGYGISGAFGGYLGRELVPAQTHEGAVGGQLLGAVGSAIGITAALSGALDVVLNFIVPGIGSLIGTIVGTLIGDAVGSQPHPAATDFLAQAGNHYGFGHYQVSASDGGDYGIADPMASATASIVNAYFGAVKGVVLDHSMMTWVGYVTDPDFRYVSGAVPFHSYRPFVHPDDAVHAAALDVLQHSEVIGGDLLLKRAHQNSASNIPDPAPDGSVPSEQSAAEKLVTLGGDLQVAADYENYLNNREAINAVMATNPDSAFTAGWIATFARVNDLRLNHAGANDFLGGLVGWLDSVKKAGLVFDAAGVSYNQAGSTALIDIKLANGTFVPGALSAFTDQFTETSDSTGTTLHFVINSGIVPLGFRGPDSSTLVSGEWQVTGGSGNNLWFGSNATASTFNATGNGNDILIGGSTSEHIFAGEGWNFVDGGDGFDWITSGSGNDILHGGRSGDRLEGGGGDDTYTFNRGDGADLVIDDYRYLVLDSTGSPAAPGTTGGSTHEVHGNGGTDTLAFGPGITPADVSVRGNGDDLIIAVKDPAHPGVAFAQLADNITLSKWTDALDRVENLAFADGTVLSIADGASLAALRVPFGAALSGNTVFENAANGTVVGTVTGYDLDSDVRLHYALTDSAGGRFAINGSTGAISVANGFLLDYEVRQSWQVTVRTLDDASYSKDTSFTIAVADVPEAPVGAVLSGGSVAENAANGTAVGTVTATDPDPHAVLSWSLLDNAGGRFAINGASGAITVANGAALDYEAATSHQITVRVADQAGHVFDRAFTIAVGNINEAPTGAILSDNHVAENAANGTPVGTVSGIDPDAATVFHYSLTDDAGGRFAIDGSSGAITVANGMALDYEAATSHQITVRTADEVGHVFDKAFTIAVTDVLEGPVDMALSGHTVEENSAYGTRVGTATATDPDAHAVLTWSLLDSAGGRFAINAASGEITVASAVLDYESAQTHRITVRAADQDGHLLDRDFTIAVTDVVETPGPALHDAVTIASGDFNGDGKDDILWRNDSGAVATWDMNDRSFGGAVIANVPNDWHIAGTGDFNGDGKTDILWRNDSGAVATWDMNDRSFGGAVIDTATGNDWHIAGTGDFNGDGKTDILWRNDSDPVATWDMNDRSFGAAVIDTATTNDWHIAGTGDFNGDGKDDILWRNDNGAVATWDMNDRSFGGTVIANVSTDWYIAGTGDFNGDHKTDILWRNDNGAVATWDMDDHNFGSAVIANVSNDWHIASTGDYNGDGRSDILWRNDNGAVATWDMYDRSFGGAVIAGVPNDWHIA
jgi:hypothetical protein